MLTPHLKETISESFHSISKCYLQIVYKKFPLISAMLPRVSFIFGFQIDDDRAKKLPFKLRRRKTIGQKLKIKALLFFAKIL